MIDNKDASPLRKQDLILHPVRIRILTQIFGHPMTTAMLAKALPDIAQATLYRQVKTLLEGGILEVVNEREAHGAIERTYAVAQGGDRLTNEDLSQLSAEEHLRYFTIFSTALLDTFATYIQSADLANLVHDGLSYNTIALYLNDAERDELRLAFQNIVQQAVQRPPAAGRRRYTLASVVIPESEIKGS